MPPIRRPSVRLIQLARELKRLREEVGTSREDVIAATGISSPTLSRAENAATAISPDTVSALLDLYGVTDELRDSLMQLARDAQKRGWWQAYRGVFKGAYVGLEDEASAIWTFEPLVVPGLLQTGDYMRALVSVSPSAVGETDELRVQARSGRQNLLTRPTPPETHFVIGEAVLHQAVGNAKVMQRQISHLWQMSERDRVTIQVVPFAAGAHHGLDGSFTILGFAQAGMEIGHVEGPGGSLLLESQTDLKEINLRRQSIHKVACSPEESAEMLRDFADRIKE
jgi:transcriptional regulator with XRE-family HTH domain